MRSFFSWLHSKKNIYLLDEGSKELAREYKRMLQGVPQEPSHHPEGDVLTHIKLVRKAIPKAIRILQDASRNPSHPVYPVIGDVDFSLNNEEMDILKMSAWLHDIGKASATTVGGVFWHETDKDLSKLKGRIQSIGHDRPEHFMPQIMKLSPLASKDVYDFYKKHESLINWLIENHMVLYSGQGFPKRIVREYFHNGKMLNQTPIKLLVILILSDKLGRGPAVVEKGINQLFDGLLKSSEVSKRMYKKQQSGVKEKFSGSVEEFVQMLLSKNVNPSVIVKSTLNKFPELSKEQVEELIRKLQECTFYTESHQPYLEKASIPIPKSVEVVAKALKANDPNTEVYAVGGAVRDFLMGRPASDVDLTTNLNYDQIVERLQKAGIDIAEKSSDTFGVVFANPKIGGVNDIVEVAPFRMDIGVAGGRRPEGVKFNVSMKDDAMRRDFTINNLYYDFGYGKYGKGVVIDFNPGGRGIQDIKSKVVRVVGNPADRFVEDRLRILRLLRFFSRFNDGDILSFLDKETINAIKYYGDLRRPMKDEYSGLHLQAISAERIAEEFVKGIKQAINVESYIKNYHRLGMLKDVVFPGLVVDIDGVGELKDARNVPVLFAWILRHNDDRSLSSKLVSLKYPRGFSDYVEFLVSLININEEDVYFLLKKRKRNLQRFTSGGELADDDFMKKLYHDVSSFSHLLPPKQQSLLSNFMGVYDEEEGWVVEPYREPPIDVNEIKKMGYKRNEIGQIIKKMVTDDFKQRMNENVIAYWAYLI